MTSDTTKLLKHVDADVWRRFRALCIAEGVNMGPAISALMLGALMGKVGLQRNGTTDAIDAKSRSGSWTWPTDRESGTP
jgi:hypothetical protein